MANLLSLLHDMGLWKNRHVRSIIWLVFYHINPLIKEVNKSSLERTEHKQKQWSWYALYLTNVHFNFQIHPLPWPKFFVQFVRIPGKRLQLQESLFYCWRLFWTSESLDFLQKFSILGFVYISSLWLTYIKGIWANVPQFSKHSSWKCFKMIYW